MNPSLLTAEGLSGLVFLGIVGVTVIGAVIATGTARLIRAVAGLGLCFLGVAGLYYYLSSPFVALMQILIYVGAVCVTIVFAVMLAEPEEAKRLGRPNPLAGPAAFIAAGILTWGLAALSLRTAWKPIAASGRDGSIAQLGRSLLTTYSMSFELISVVLLVAIIGSLVLARTGRSRS